VKRSETPGTPTPKKIPEPAEAGDSGCDYKNALMPLSAAPRTSNNFVDCPWGFASLHPRLYAFGRSAGWKSYAIALVFIAGRFVLGVTGWEALGVEIAQAIIWSCLALSVVLADVAIHWKEIRSALTVPVRAGVSRKDNLIDSADSSSRGARKTLS
jgi:hypothetical protein